MSYAYLRTGTFIPTAELFDGKPSFHFIDVGQGDCVLVTYRGEAVLVDAGPQMYAEATAEYVRMYSPTVDYFIVTHSHEDHMGGAEEILSSARIDALVMSTLTSDEAFYKNTLSRAEERGCEVMLVDEGCVFSTGNITVTVYDVFDFFDTVESEDEYNNASLFVKIEAGGTSLLITGDAELEEERYACSAFGDMLDCDILKVGHHGSKTSTSDELLLCSTPMIAVISCARNNSYGHPNTEVIDRLTEYGIDIKRSDRSGTIILRGE